MIKKISGKQAVGIFFMFWTGSSLAVGYADGAKQDTWISLLIASLLMVPSIFLYSRIVALYPDRDIFQIMMEVFGKVAGKTVAVLLEVFVLILGGLVNRTFTEFVQVENMPETPQALIAVMFILLSVWAIKCGIEAFGRTSHILYILLIVFVTVTFIIMTKDMHISNLKPVMSTSLPVLLENGVSIYSLPLAESFLFISLFPYIHLQSKSSPKKIYGGSLLAITILFLVVNFRNISILGKSGESFFFSSYQATSIVSIGEFFTRMEVSIGINLLMAGFIKQCFCLFVASLGLMSIFNLNSYKTLVTPCALIFFLINHMSASNTLEFSGFSKVYPYIALPFEVLLPLLLFICAEIKTRTQKASSQTDIAETMAD